MKTLLDHGLPDTVQIPVSPGLSQCEGKTLLSPFGTQLLVQHIISRN